VVQCVPRQSLGTSGTHEKPDYFYLDAYGNLLLIAMIEHRRVIIVHRVLPSFHYLPKGIQ
jgi:hypothetical protein